MINLILVFIDTMHYTYKDKLFMVVLYIDLMVNLVLDLLSDGELR